MFHEELVLFFSGGWWRQVSVRAHVPALTVSRSLLSLRSTPLPFLLSFSLSLPFSSRSLFSLLFSSLLFSSLLFSSLLFSSLLFSSLLSSLFISVLEILISLLQLQVPRGRLAGRSRSPRGRLSLFPRE